MDFNFENDLSQSRKFKWPHSEPHLAEVFKNESKMLEKPLTTNSQVPGNIHNPKFFNFWKDDLGVDENFQKFLKEGYPLPFINDIPPPSVFSRNNRSFMENLEFGIEEIKRLEKLGCIYPVEEQPEIVLPLSVVYSTKVRMVVDASRHLNDYLVPRKVKLETLDDADLVVEEGDCQAI